jgi:short-subunit dehydrogenase
MTDLDQKIILVTGASGGFGRHMTDQLLARGSRLILTDLHDDALDTLRAEFSHFAGSIAATIAADLSTAEGCRLLAYRCEKIDLRPDVLINNAGIAVAGRHDHVPDDRWEALMQVNLLTPMRLCSLFLPQMIARGDGHIVNISSLAGWVGAPNLSSYAASKYGLRGFGEALAADVDKHNVRVSNVYPSFSRTPILQSQQFGIEQRRAVPEHMISEPADVVAAIIRGVERNRLHIFPDKTALRVHYLKRFFPWIIPYLNRRMEAQATLAD